MLTTKLLLGESGTHTGERCLLHLTPCYFVPRLTLLLTFDGRTSICRSYTGRVPATSYEFTATSRRLKNNTTERNLILIHVVIINTCSIKQLQNQTISPIRCNNSNLSVYCGVLARHCPSFVFYEVMLDTII